MPPRMGHDDRTVCAETPSHDREWLAKRYQQEVLEYLVEENRVLKEQFKGRRLRLTTINADALPLRPNASVVVF